MTSRTIAAIAAIAGSMQAGTGHAGVPAGRVQTPAAAQEESAATPTQILSPSVIAAWVTERTGNEPERLELLVLWRGSPGWYLKVPGGGVTGGQSSGRYSQTITYAGRTLTVSFEPATRTAVVDGRRIDLGDDNVVLLDGADSAAGTQVVKTMRVPRTLPGSAVQIGPVIARVPELMTFLRCDALPADGRGRGYFATLCLQNLGTAR